MKVELIVNGEAVTNDWLRRFRDNIDAYVNLLQLKLHGPGVLDGLGLSENTPTPDLNILIASGYGWEGYGKLIRLTSQQTKDCSIDRNGSSIIPSAGNERYISIVAKHDTALTNPQPDPIEGTLYIYEDDGFVIEVIAGPEATVGSGTLPTIAADELLLGDIGPILSTTTAITDAMIDVSRVQEIADAANLLATTGTPSAEHPEGVRGTDDSAARSDHRHPGPEFFADTGAADALVITPSPAITAYAAGQRYWINPAATNTGAATLNVSGLGAKAIKLPDGTDPWANHIRADYPIHLYYDGTNFVLINPPPVEVKIDPYQQILASGNATSWTSISLSSLVPVGTKWVRLWVELSSGAAESHGCWLRSSDAGSEGKVGGGRSGDTTNKSSADLVTLAVSASRTIEYRVMGGTNSASIYLRNYGG